MHRGWFRHQNRIDRRGFPKHFCLVEHGCESITRTYPRVWEGVYDPRTYRNRDEERANNFYKSPEEHNSLALIFFIPFIVTFDGYVRRKGKRPFKRSVRVKVGVNKKLSPPVFVRYTTLLPSEKELPYNRLLDSRPTRIVTRQNQRVVTKNDVRKV